MYFSTTTTTSQPNQQPVKLLLSAKTEEEEEEEEYDAPSIARYNNDFDACKLKQHLDNESMNQYEFWFGPDIFSSENDVDDNRPSNLTARDAIARIEAIYINADVKRTEHQLIKAAFNNIAYSPTVYPLPESYFRAFLKSQLKAANLGRAITDQDITDITYLQLVAHFGDPLAPTCEVWNSTTPTNQTLKTFKSLFEPAMLRLKPKPPTGSANHAQAVGEIRDDVNILDDNQVDFTNQLADMKTKFAALANAVNARSPANAPSSAEIQSRVDAQVQLELARINSGRPPPRTPPGDRPPFAWIAEQPWRIKKTTNSVTVEGRQYWWCSHHKVKDRYDGLYVCHKECEHGAWKVNKDQANKARIIALRGY